MMKPIALFIFTLAVSSCREQPTEPRQPSLPPAQIALTVEGVSEFSVRLRLGFPDTLLPRRYRLNRDGALLQSGIVANSDTVLVDTNLVSLQSYRYEAMRLDSAGRPTDTAAVSATPVTSDTTSHDFTWTTETFGEGGGSSFYDVAIINDTLAYAVGEIYLRDSTGQPDPTLYNLATWNGQSWTISRVYYNFQGQPGVAPKYCIFAFGANDIWIGDSVPYHWDGTKWTEFSITGVFSGTVNRIWGTSSSDLYIVSSLGSIAHYNGVVWKQLASGTSLPIRDLWGAYDSTTAQWEILAVASVYTPAQQERKILKINPANQTVSTVADSGLALSLNAIWFVPSRQYLCGGDGLHYASNLNAL